MGNSASKSKDDPSPESVNEDSSSSANTVIAHGDDLNGKTVHNDSNGKTANDDSSGNTVHNDSTCDTVNEDSSANTVIAHDVNSNGKTVDDDSTGDTVNEDESANNVHGVDPNGKTVNEDSTRDTVNEDESANTVNDVGASGETVDYDSTGDDVYEDASANIDNDDSNGKILDNDSTVHDGSTGDTVYEEQDDSAGDIENDEYEHLDKKDVPEYIEEHGVHGVEKLFKAKAKTEWEDVRIKIGVTGNAGVGKSSFINAMRGLDDDHVLAAPTGVIETTKVMKEYPFPQNEKIVFSDLPGIGTPDYPDLTTYCRKVSLMTYDTFLILTADRFTENDRLLAQEIKSMGKTFFLVRTKVDISCMCEEHKLKTKFREEETLKVIREDCRKNLKILEVGDEVLFLISNYKPEKLDFPRLMEAILDALPSRQKQCLTLSLDLLTTRSKDIMKRKVEVLRGRIWYVAAVSGTCGLVPVPGFKAVVDVALLRNTVDYYKKQLGLPEENSYEFKKMTPKTQKKLQEFCLTSAVQIGNVVGTHEIAKTAIASEVTQVIPVVGSVIAGGISFSSTYFFLKCCLNDMEEAALEFLDILNKNVANDIK